MFRAVDPEVDEEGCFFICPGCKARNPLVNVGRGGPEDPLELAQPPFEVQADCTGSGL